MKRLLGPALLFMAIALALYAALYVASEQLLRRNGHSNPLFKIDQLSETSVDWVVLGASHAMPLDFDDVNAGIERASGQRIVQLAGARYGSAIQPLRVRALPASPQHAQFALCRRRLRVLLADLERRPLLRRQTAAAHALGRCPGCAARTLRARRGRRSGRAARLRQWFFQDQQPRAFERDVWEGEAQFERTARPARGAIAKRIAYLYPDKTAPQTLARYLRGFDTLLALARQQGVQVLVVKMPLPREFRQQLPDETAFDEALAHVVAAHGARLVDLSAAIDDPRSYFDTDHLNRAGLQAFIDRSLTPLLVQRVP